MTKMESGLVSLHLQRSHFRARAEECRKLADITGEPSRSSFLQVARSYDALAREQELLPKARRLARPELFGLPSMCDDQIRID
jgi:hypothetical protein